MWALRNNRVDSLIHLIGPLPMASPIQAWRGTTVLMSVPSVYRSVTNLSFVLPLFLSPTSNNLRSSVCDND